jgi:hypothetical protein
LKLKNKQNRSGKRAHGSKSKVMQKQSNRRCMACLVEGLANGSISMPSLAELFGGKPEIARDYLLDCYYRLFLYICSGASALEWETEIREWVHDFGKDEAERVILTANKQWAEKAPTLWGIFCEGTDREKSVVHRIQVERHQRQECELCKHREKGTPSATLIERELPKIEALVKTELDNPLRLANAHACPQKRNASAPWEALLSE